MSTPWCAVLGDPIDHSLSPVLHTAGYREVGLVDWEYRRVRVDVDGLGAFLAGRADGCRGLSLTMPLKRAVLEHADEVSDIARTAGAANTLVVGPDGRLRADNTDIAGAANAIRETYDGTVDSATIWGGGATAASLLLALAGLGCRRFTLQVRDPQRAGETLEVARRHPERLDVTVGGGRDGCLLGLRDPADQLRDQQSTGGADQGADGGGVEVTGHIHGRTLRNLSAPRGRTHRQPASRPAAPAAR